MTRKTCTNPPHVDIVLQSVCHELGLYDCYGQRKHLTRHKHQNISSDLIKLKRLCKSDPAVELFLKINGIALSENSKDTFSYKMPTTRTSSLSHKAQQTPLSSADSKNNYSDRLRTRRHTTFTNNFTDTSGDDDSNHINPIRELRSSSRLALALVKSVERRGQDTWDSGRPKRNCIKPKRTSADERLVVDNKSYYKVEILSNKLRSSGLCNRETTETPVYKRVRSPPTYCEDSEDERAFKFKKLRGAELVRLNNEAENFLFPPKDESSSEEDVTTPPNNKKRNNTLTTPVINTNHKPVRNCTKHEPEEESSMDSTSSEIFVSRKKRRLTQAESFILDNQKYYKFETPGSRLRYQGSYLAPLPAKNNGEHVINKQSKHKEHREVVQPDKVDLNLDDLKFSFESPPRSESWYKTFQRQDNAEESYSCYNYNTGFYKPFLLPYEVGPLPPLDPRYCFDSYQQLRDQLYEDLKIKPDADDSIKLEENSNDTSTSEIGEETKSSEDTTLDSEVNENFRSKAKYFKRTYKRKLFNVGRNPRKSPRQHASTLAILSSFIQNRKRKEKMAKNEQKLILARIAEEVIKEQEIDYDKIARNIDEMFSEDFEELECDEQALNDGYSFDLHCNNDPVEMLEDCINCKKNDETLDINSPINKSPKSALLKRTTTGRKVGRKRKKNRTGWPNKNRRALFKKDATPTSEPSTAKEDVEKDSNQDKAKLAKLLKEITTNEDKLNGSIETIKINGCTNLKSLLGSPKRKEHRGSSSDNCAEVVIASVGDKIDCVNVDLDKWESAERVLSAKLRSETINNDIHFQPIVRVQKLDTNIISTVKRNNKLIKNNNIVSSNLRTRPRRMPASPKSPRIFRRPRGACYRERYSERINYN